MSTLLISFLLLAQVENDAKRYHDAYVLEVIEGRTADAAKAYLALMEDADASQRLRLQAEFRFAVCSALLGRADEGRARLARLAMDPDLPADLKPQVEEYRKALEKVGLGTALDAKLQELTMQLAGVSSSTNSPPAYREFAVLGERAVPYLKSLLGHPDADIRRHAWRILLRMDVPDLVPLWDPEMKFVEEFRAYLKDHPERIRAFEARLRTIGAARTAELIGLYDSVGSYSEEFCVWLAGSDAQWAPYWGIQLLSNRPKTPETEAFLLNWLADGTPEQQKAAARCYGAWASAEGPMRRPPECFGRFIDLCIENKLSAAGGVTGYALAVPLPMRLDALERILAAEPERQLSDAYKMLFEPFLTDLAASIEKDASSDADIARYRGLLRKWVEAVERRAGWGRVPKDSRMPEHLRWVVVRSPADAVAPIVKLVARHRAAHAILATVLGFERPDDAALLRTAIEEIAPSDRKRAWALLFDSVHPGLKPGAGYLEAVAPLWTMFVDVDDVVNAYPEFALRIEAEAAQGVVLAMLHELEARVADRWTDALFNLFPNATRLHGNPKHLSYAYGVAFPILGRSWGIVPALQRGQLIDFAIALTCFGDVPDAYRREARAFITAHLDEVSDARVSDWSLLVNHAERLAPELWIPRISPHFWQAIATRAPFAPGYLVETVRGFERKPELLNDNALYFLVRIAPAGEVARLAKSLYPDADDALLALFVRNKLPCPVGIRERKLLDYVEKTAAPDPRLVLDLATSVLQDQPSPRLFPVVEWLLAREERDVLMGAIRLADALGSEKLVGKLVPLLDSLDRNIREGAKQTIDNILQNRRIREEVASRIR